GAPQLAIVVTATDAAGGPVTQLAVPLTLHLTFTPAAGANPLLARVYTLDPQGNAQELPTHVVDNHDGTYTATAQTTHLSPFNVYAPGLPTPVPQIFIPSVSRG